MIVEISIWSIVWFLLGAATIAIVAIVTYMLLPMLKKYMMLNIQERAVTDAVIEDRKAGKYVIYLSADNVKQALKELGEEYFGKDLKSGIADYLSTNDPEKLKEMIKQMDE